MDSERNENGRIILYQQPDGRGEVALIARDGSVWLTQAQMAELFNTSKQNVGRHILSVFKAGELPELETVRSFPTIAGDGKEYEVYYYNLEVIIAVGFRVRGTRGTQFRQWANRNLREFLIKGFVIDSERLKNPDGRPDYFDELLAQIRDIRASEKRFYQKLRDLFALSSDYDKTDKSTQMFFAQTQNKLIYAVTRQTAAELILARANAETANMGLTAWQGAIVRKQDIIIAKNYLTAEELDALNRLVVLFLDSAELRARGRKDLTMNYWRENVDRLLEFQDLEVLRSHGSVSNTEMKEAVGEIYEQFDASRKAYERELADQYDDEELKQLEARIEKKE